MAKVQYEIVEHDGGWRTELTTSSLKPFQPMTTHLPQRKLRRISMRFPDRRRTSNSKIPPVVGMNRWRLVSIARVPRSSIHRTFGTRQNAGSQSTATHLVPLCSSLVLPSRSATFVVLPAVGNSRALTYRAHRRAYGQARQRFEGAGLKCDTAALPVPQSVRM